MQYIIFHVSCQNHLFQIKIWFSSNHTNNGKSWAKGQKAYTSCLHSKNVITIERNLRALTDLDRGIVAQLEIEYEKKLASNTYVLLRLLSSMHFVGRQAVAIWGKDDNCSNFVNLIEVDYVFVLNWWSWMKNTNILRVFENYEGDEKEIKSRSVK